MCCFSIARPASFFARLLSPKLHVSRTSILARMASPGVQALAYGMDLDSAREVAMVLPLPVRAGAGDDAIRFIDLQKHPRMFAELSAMFEMEALQPKGGISRPGGRRLAVHAIGAFVASYVATRTDFSRLDPRFRMPDVLFDAVPHYADWGFAVFQLVPGKVTVHPMAFTFPTREPDRLFFPTVHVHDGAFHPTAKFDHALYYQDPTRIEAGGRLGDDAVAGMKPRETYEGLLDVERPVLRRVLRARLPNEDTFIATRKETRQVTQSS
jgi:hypothetical protein